MSRLANSIPQEERRFDLICLGRLAVDLYGEQLGTRLEDVRSFAKYLGGSSANIACGSSRLGLRVSMLSRVGDEQFGQFLTESLEREGCDTSQVMVDSERLTALAILSIRNQQEFPLLFYRDNCADMAIDAKDIDAEHIAASRALLITGTHFSTDGVMKASLQALEYARCSHTMCVLDIDYRPVLWGLTDKGEGDNRFVVSDAVTERMHSILPHFQLIVGTEEEFNIAGGSEQLIDSLKVVREHSQATLLVKRGAAGCVIFDGSIPDTIDQGFVYSGFEVDVLNVLGAGDAFMSGFLYGLLNGEDFEQCCRLANACGALVVSRHACSPSMPTPVELQYFLKNRTEIERIDRNAELNLLHRISQKDKEYQDLAILAFDHRKQFVDMARAAGADLSLLPKVKNLLLESYLEVVKSNGLQARAGVLIDDSWGMDALFRVSGSGMWIARPVERPSSRPIEFEGGRNIGQKLIQWPVDHQVKCLVFYHPDDPAELRYEQERQVVELYQACCFSGHKLLLEVVPPKGAEQQINQLIPRVLTRFYNLGVHPHWWKLPPLSTEGWHEISALINERSPWCRGVLLLGLNASVEVLAEGFAAASQFPLCKGFAIGRSIFYQPVQEWLAGTIQDDQLQQQIANNYLELVNLWDRSKQQ